MLTAKQKELLLYIHKCVQSTGVPPSFDEMKTALELRSKSGIHRLITALEERGFVKRLAHRARALEIIKLPDALADAVPRRAPHLAAGAGLSRLEPAHGGGFREPQQAAYAAAQSTTIPMMGRIAAGVPISAIEDHSRDIACPPDMIGSGEHFALEVKGDSMIEAGIHDGDTVIIKITPTAENGDIVVAVVENEEATLKRLRKRGASIALEAANPTYETRIFGPDQITIKGRLVGLMRRY